MQIVLLPVISHAGVAKTVLLQVLLHPDALVTVTEYGTNWVITDRNILAADA